MTRLALPLALLALAAASCLGDRAGDQPTEDAYLYRERATPYAGPGRDAPAPEPPTEVAIGWFGPGDAGHPLAGGMWSAACLALEEANERGGFDGLPYRLIPAWSENPWGTGVKDVTRLVYREGVWALVGSPDGPSAHLVEQVTAKARLVFVNPVSTDKSTNLANVPWIFSVAPGDHLFAPLLVGALIDAARGESIAIVSGTDHDSRLLTRELFAAFRARGTGPELHLELPPQAASFERQLGALRGAAPAALAVIAGPLESGALVRTLREAGLAQPVVGGPSLGRRAFAETAGAAAEGVLFPLLWDREAAGVEAEVFARRFEQRTGLEPDHTEAFAHDALTLLLAAITNGGLNRTRIGDAVRAIAPWSGVSGPVRWDRTGHNTRAVPLGTWRGGRRVRVSESEPTRAGHRAATGARTTRR